MYKITHWLGVILIASFTVIFVFKPYLLGFAEHPEIRQIKNILMVDLEGSPLNDWLHLERKYGCKFWNNQGKLMSFYNNSIEMNRDSHRNSEEFLKNHKENRDTLERKIEQLDGRTSSDKEILIAKLLKSGLKGELRELEKERSLNLEFIAIYEKMNPKDQEKFILATSIETAIRTKHASCFDEKSSHQLK
jgi:hypothetical protein